MTETKTKPLAAESSEKSARAPAQTRPRWSSQMALFAVLAAGSGIGAGYWLAGFVPQENVADSRVRLGYVLTSEPIEATSKAWDALARDLAQVRASLPAQRRGIFDLVAATRGLYGPARPDLARAERACRSLGWPRCDRDALQSLHRKPNP
jgi:hypothetical protein